MSALGILVLTAACSGPATTEPRPAAPPATAPPPAPSEPAPVVDACAADAARLQPSLDANLALYDRLGFPPEAVETMDLVRATTELERVPAGLPVVTMTPTLLELQRQAGSPRAIRSRLDALGAPDLVLAIERKTPWPAVAQLLETLPVGQRVHLAFAIESSTPPIGDPATVQRLRAGGGAAFRDLGRDMTQRCPAVGDLFMADDLVGAFARRAVPALLSCDCAVSADELANVYQALTARTYVSARTFTTSATGTPITAPKAATFADVAPAFFALSPGAAVGTGS